MRHSKYLLKHDTRRVVAEKKSLKTHFGRVFWNYSCQFSERDSCTACAAHDVAETSMLSRARVALLFRNCSVNPGDCDAANPVEVVDIDVRVHLAPL